MFQFEPQARAASTIGAKQASTLSAFLSPPEEMVPNWLSEAFIVLCGLVPDRMHFNIMHTPMHISKADTEVSSTGAEVS